MSSAIVSAELPKTRLFVEPDRLGTDRAIVSGQALHHMKNVLKLKPGDELMVFDGCGREAVGVLEIFQGETAVVRVVRDADRSTESSLELTLAPCLSKGKKIDTVIEKAVELGVDRICVVTSERSVTRLADDAAAKRVERWRRIAVSAAEQSGRTQIPIVERIRTFQEFCASKSDDTLGLMFTANAAPDPAGTLRQRYPNTRKVITLVGPEGGFSDAEISTATSYGFIPVGLGPRVLRTETAGIIAAAICQHLWGDLGRQPPEHEEAHE
jgi:16S rRNA (uracil1498-N3)-methyltransferase